MNTGIYRLVYCSRNRIQGTPAEVDVEIRQILTTARANNAALGVTGALFYNSGNFAQVLEGPLSAVEVIFEKVQCDARHSEVVVVESGMAAGRGFADWSMALCESSRAQVPEAAVAFGAAFSGEQGAGEKILAVMRELVMNEDEAIFV